MRLVLQDDNGNELARLDGVGEGLLGLENVNPATGSVRLTFDMSLAMARMLYDCGARPESAVKPKPKDNVRQFGRT
jgi:hypothetical protein